MKIAVVGGAGFIGSHLVDRLLAAGHDIDVIDDLSNGSLGNLAEARGRATGSNGSLKIHHLDARSDDATTLIGMRRPELMYDLSLFPRADRSASGQIRAVEHTLASLEAARRYGVAKVVVTLPASAVYGQPPATSLPVKEGDTAPRGVRGVAARAVIDLLGIYRERDMIEFTALALASVYGPRQRAGDGVVAAFVAALDAGRPPTFAGDGRQTRDFVYIDDAVDALVRAGERGSGLLINVGTGVQTTIRELWSMVSGGVVGEPQIDEVRPDEVLRFAVSPVRARIHLGWSPWTGLADGLARVRA